MGGGQSLDAGLNNPDLFDYVGGFSPAVILLDPDYT
jgi:S-formylglutathione hydrolase FrmB